MQLNSKYPHLRFCYVYYKSVDCGNREINPWCIRAFIFQTLTTFHNRFETNVRIRINYGMFSLMSIYHKNNHHRLENLKQ